jgi:hypothetical protein
MTREFVPIPPAGFDIAGSFDGVTTAVGQGGVPRIRHQLTGTQFRSGGLAGLITRQVVKGGVGDEAALGGLHTRLELALLMVGSEPEAGLTVRLDERRPNGRVLGRYLDKAGERKFGAMALVRSDPGLIEILVTECDSEDHAREVIDAAIATYV